MHWGQMTEGLCGELGKKIGEFPPSMVGRGRFAMVQHNQSLCTRPGFGLRFTAETWFLGAAEQPTFAAFKQLELTSVVP